MKSPLNIESLTTGENKRLMAAAAYEADEGADAARVAKIAADTNKI